MYRFPKGGVYEGEWRGGRMEGVGVRTYASGKVQASLPGARLARAGGEGRAWAWAARRVQLGPRHREIEGVQHFS